MGDPGSILVGKIPWRREGLPTPVFLLEHSMDRGAWQVTVPGLQRVRQTEQMHFHFQRQWKCSVWCYSDGYTSLPICPNPQNIKHQEWTIMWAMDFEWGSQCRLISCNKCASPVGDVENGGGYVWVGASRYLDLSVPFAQFGCEPKTALKFFSLKIKSGYGAPVCYLYQKSFPDCFRLSPMSL